MVFTNAAHNPSILSQIVYNDENDNDENSCKKICLLPKKDLSYLDLAEDKFLVSVKSFKCVTDSGSYWDETFNNHISNELKMAPAEIDSFTSLKTEKEIDRVHGSDVDVSLHSAIQLLKGVKGEKWENIEFRAMD